MAVAIAGTAATNTQTGGTSISATLPGSIATGDLLRINISTVFSVTVTTPSGWTSIANVEDGYSSNRVVAFYRVADGSEGASVTVSLSTACDATSIAWRVTGQNTSTPINVSATNSATSGSTTAITAPTVTTTVDGCMIERIASTRQSTGITNPASHTDIGTATTGTGSTNDTQRVCYAMQTTAGATGTAAFVGSGVGREWASMTIAIAPAAGGGGVAKIGAMRRSYPRVARR